MVLKSTTSTSIAVPASRKRLKADERAVQILYAAIQFFSKHGLDGQMRVLATEIGITHTLLYHYFPTKQALIERVYQELFEGRWRQEWESLLDDPAIDVEEKFIRFYCDYAECVLSREFVRIFVFSGLSDYFITDRFFALLRERLFPRLIRETRKARGIASRAKTSNAEFELLMGLHGGIFYSSVRRYIYGQETPSTAPAEAHAIIADRVRAYLLSAAAVLHNDDIGRKKIAIDPAKVRTRTSTKRS